MAQCPVAQTCTRGPQSWEIDSRPVQTRRSLIVGAKSGVNQGQVSQFRYVSRAGEIPDASPRVGWLDSAIAPGVALRWEPRQTIGGFIWQIR
jgi:hypothetical protein